MSAKVNRARVTDLATLAIASFNTAIVVHWLVANFWISLTLWTTTIVGTVLAAAILNLSDHDEGNLLFVALASIVGGIVTWLLL